MILIAYDIKLMAQRLEKEIPEIVIRNRDNWRAFMDAPANSPEESAAEDAHRISSLEWEAMNHLLKALKEALPFAG